MVSNRTHRVLYFAFSASVMVEICQEQMMVNYNSLEVRRVAWRWIDCPTSEVNRMTCPLLKIVNGCGREGM